jgi:uncharacterized membrane protein
MSTLIAIAYEGDEHRAAEVLATLQRLQGEYLLDLDDAVYVTRSRDGKFKLHQTTNLVAAGAASGALWGALFGLIFFVPIFGLAVGAGMGALGGKLADFGIDDNFVRKLASSLPPGSSAIFMLVRQATIDRAVPELGKFGGTILHTNLPDDLEQRLQQALQEGKLPAMAPQPAVATQSAPAEAPSAATQAGIPSA